MPVTLPFDTTAIWRIAAQIAKLTPTDASGAIAVLRRRPGYANVPWAALVAVAGAYQELGTAAPSGGVAAALVAAGLDVGNVIRAVSVASGSGAAGSGTVLQVGGQDGTSLAQLFSTDGAGRQKVVPRVADWSTLAVPAVNTVASCNKAAAAGVRHVCTAISVSLHNVGGVAGTFGCQLLDGATNLFQVQLSISATAGDKDHVVVPFPSGLVGTVNTAMTLAFTAGPGANNQQAVAMEGYDLANND